MPAGEKRLGRAHALDRASSLRVPLEGGAGEAARSKPATERPSLRLALAKGALGIELDAPYRLGPVTIRELALTLTGVRFPVDLSGGVARFRHRRGALTRIAVEARPADVSAWAARRLRGLLSDATPDLVIAPLEAGALIGMRAGDAVLAFEVTVAPGERDLRLIPERARGIGLGMPPHVLALRALGAMGQSIGHVIGGALVISDAVGTLARSVLPDAGARAPSVTGVRWEPLDTEGGELKLEGVSNAPPPALPDRALRALEFAELAAEADEAAFRGDIETARARYMSVLERAPRHREISERIAWIDVIAGDRTEAALSTLIDAVPATDAGLLGGGLLAALGDPDGAVAALSRAAHIEPYSALAALMWLRVAELAQEIDVRLGALDQAVTRAPALEKVRWARLEARLDIADVRGAKADAEHLEAAARGSEARHAVWRRAADAFLARGFIAEAGALFERALRYVPDSADAVIGLARSLRAAGQPRRALDLFARAAAMEARGGKPSHTVTLELARGLAEVADDRPAAIARVRRIPPDAPESLEARALEGRWRAELGDLAGASIALGRLRDAVELAHTIEGDRAAAVAALLVEAAQIEERERGDLLSAQRHLGLALRLRPRDRAIASAFRRVAAEAARATKDTKDTSTHEGSSSELPPVVSPRAVSPRSASPRAALPNENARRSLADVFAGGEGRTGAAMSAIAATGYFETPTAAKADDGPSSEAASEARDDGIPDEQLVEQLTDRVRASPNDHPTAMRLADALERLGRDMDLLALLSARMEEGDDAARIEVTPRRRRVLLRLAEQARAEGRSSEAELYELMAGDEPG